MERGRRQTQKAGPGNDMSASGSNESARSDKLYRELNKQERYCKEQRDLLRALEDLEANERVMYELDHRKDQVMTIFKVALTNVVMWIREHFFSASFAQATWKRLAPFFPLRGQVRQHSSSVFVELSRFNDRQYNRDLAVLCERVNNASLHVPDGRRLLLTVKTISRPILEVQKCPVA